MRSLPRSCRKLQHSVLILVFEEMQRDLRALVRPPARPALPLPCRCRPPSPNPPPPAPGASPPRDAAPALDAYVSS